MTDEEKALIAYRMERAQQAIIEAKTLFDAGLLNAYVNRLYYACFYAVSANNFIPKRNRSALNLFMSSSYRANVTANELNTIIRYSNQRLVSRRIT